MEFEGKSEHRKVGARFTANPTRIKSGLNPHEVAFTNAVDGAFCEQKEKVHGEATGGPKKTGGIGHCQIPGTIIEILDPPPGFQNMSGLGTKQSLQQQYLSIASGLRSNSHVRRISDPITMFYYCTALRVMSYVPGKVAKATESEVPCAIEASDSGRKLSAKVR
ncbi:hypothetical protein KEM54_003133 [Ascosphaera aggregata]|nr:hypothetical protein KEM54_003133 [Ascosphaera aggregata]